MGIPWNGWRGRWGCSPAPPGDASAAVGLRDPVEIGELQELLLADIIHHILKKKKKKGRESALENSSRISQAAVLG